MMPARHTKSFPLFPNHYFNISGLLPCCKKWKKICHFVRPLFVGAPVRPNMLNMPKCASATDAKLPADLNNCRHHWEFAIEYLLTNKYWRDVRVSALNLQCIAVANFSSFSNFSCFPTFSYHHRRIALPTIPSNLRISSAVIRILHQNMQFSDLKIAKIVLAVGPSRFPRPISFSSQNLTMN